MTTAPKRRWLRFSLRSMLLLVAGITVVLAWEFNFVRERQAWQQSNTALIRGPDPQPVVKGFQIGYVNLSDPTERWFPFWRRWLGDAPVEHIVLPEDWSDIDSVKRLFPEAGLSQAATVYSP